MKILKQNCNECRNFWREYDTNACGCNKEDKISDTMWEGLETCPYFAEFEDITECEIE